MYLRICILGIGLVLSACEGAEVGDTGGTEAPAATPGTGAADAAKTPGVESATATTPTTTRPPNRMEEILLLEQHPGATLALPQVEVPPGPAYPNLPGAPGPSPAMGPANAPVKVFLFSDFQCPVCGRVVEPLKEIARQYPQQVQIIFKHSPLGTHQQASAAAAAAIAAFRQGTFWEYHDKLFQNQQFLSEPDLVAYAQELGLDPDRFRRDMGDPAVAAQVVYERQQAEALGAQGTPGFFVNGQRIDGWGSYMGLESMIDRALQDAARFDGAKPNDLARAATAAAGKDGALLAELMWGKSR
jgi:protein-disulfide isomerase